VANIFLLNPGMFARRRELLLSASLFLALFAIALLGARFTIDHLLHRDAVTTGNSWAKYVANNLRDIEAIAQGKSPSVESLAVLEQARQVGQVYRYTIYDGDGNLMIYSDHRQLVGYANGKLGIHNETAARAMATGTPASAVKEGGFYHPAYYAEAYLPIEHNGRRIAVIGTNVDQTEKRQHYQALFVYSALSIGFFTAFAFGVPAYAWYRRSKEKQKADEHIQFLARHDLQTQLPNRKYFFESLSMMLSNLPASGTGIALHCIDLDRLKDVNNAYGREAGDAVVRKVAERLRFIARSTDMAACFGSNSFAILQTQVTSTEAAEALARRILDEISGPCTFEGKHISVSASVGTAVAPLHGNDITRLVKCAELALDRAKSDGRNCARVFKPDMAVRLAEPMEVEEAIREAIAHESFELFFQPLVCLRKDRLVGFEALLRLPDGKGGFVPPNIFIPLAEEMGLIDVIGRWTMRRGCRIAALWPENLRLSVNLSPAQFLGSHVFNMVEWALKDGGLAPNRLALEVTESMLLSDADAVLKELSRLKQLGVRIVMDDFGTGYSSLQYLWRFPFDAIKIDRSFIDALGSKKHNMEQIVSTIVALGHTLKLKVTAEGVENEDQRNFLRSVDCDHVQGFLFGKPMPESELAAAIMADYCKSLPQNVVQLPVKEFPQPQKRRTRSLRG
jgi:diguanylate cyclase (GGDEF)-like protein